MQQMFPGGAVSVTSTSSDSESLSSNAVDMSFLRDSISERSNK